MKRNAKIILLFVVVAAQLLWLTINYLHRRSELQTAPTICLRCNENDPRDILRGDFIRLNFNLTLPLESAGQSIFWGKSLCEQVNTYSVWENGKYVESKVENPLQPRQVQAPNALEITSQYDYIRVAAFWKKAEDGFHHIVRIEAPDSAADTPAPGELRCLMWTDINNTCTAKQRTTRFNLSFSRGYRNTMRYFVEEKTGDLMRIWTEELHKNYADFPANRIRITVDIALRPSAAAVPTMLYLNGIPYPQAVEQIRNGTFPWPPDEPPAPTNE